MKKYDMYLSNLKRLGLSKYRFLTVGLVAIKDGSDCGLVDLATDKLVKMDGKERYNVTFDNGKKGKVSHTKLLEEVGIDSLPFDGLEPEPSEVTDFEMLVEATGNEKGHIYDEHGMPTNIKDYKLPHIEEGKYEVKLDEEKNRKLNELLHELGFRSNVVLPNYDVDVEGVDDEPPTRVVEVNTVGIKLDVVEAKLVFRDLAEKHKLSRYVNSDTYKLANVKEVLIGIVGEKDYINYRRRSTMRKYMLNVRRQPSNEETATKFGVSLSMVERLRREMKVKDIMNDTLERICYDAYEVLDLSGDRLYEFLKPYKITPKLFDKYYTAALKKLGENDSKDLLDFEDEVSALGF